MSGLFGTLNIGKSGMFAQQGAINTTSHNISNAKTAGYSRQRVELQTTRPYCKPSMNSAVGPGQVGTGVEIAAINRVRDSFLDYQVRVELGVQGQYASRNKFLSQIENILKEPTDVGISNLMDNLFKSWHDLSINPQTASAKSVVVEQSAALAKELNHTYNELSKLKENTQMEINNTVIEVNTILNQVNQVNQEIMQVKVAGQQPNDLMDRRDLLIDQLSEKFGMEIERENFEGINLTTSNHAKDYQKKTSPFGGESPYKYDTSTPPKKIGQLNLVQRINPDDVARFSYITEIKPKTGTTAGAAGTYEVTYYVNGDTKSDKKTIEVEMTGTNVPEQLKRLDECRVLWTDKDGKIITIENNSGENETDNKIVDLTAPPKTIEFKNLKLFEPPSGQLRGQMSVQQDIDKYQDQLNKLAKSLAFSVNAVHTQSLTEGNGIGKNDGSNLIFINGMKIDQKEPKKKENLTDADITAENIAINTIIKEDSTKIITGVTIDSGEGDGKRALAIAQLKDVFMGIQDITDGTTREKFLNKTGGTNYFQENSEYEFNGTKISTITKNVDGMTMQTYFNSVTGGLGIEEQEAVRMVKNQKEVLGGFEQARKSVSGVSLDEEFVNLVQFNHCYQANAKIISTVDQLLDVVINGLKR